MKYIRMHQVEAEPMTHGDFMKAMGKTDEAMSEQDAKAEGYLVVFPDGYKSWCPKAQFEAAGRPCDGMTFGMAIEAMKRGKKVARKGWNGKGMYLWLLPSAEVKKDWCRDERLIEVMANFGENVVQCLGSIRMLTADKKVLTGWLASQTDMLAEDWLVVE